MWNLIDLPVDKEGSFPIVRSLFDARADWQGDGHGIIGPQRVVRQEPAQPHPMDFQTDQSTRRSEEFRSQDVCAPPGGDTTKIYIKATHYTGGQWTCYWLDTTTC
jgi:hypothetical protein